MTLDLHDRLHEATTALVPTRDLVARSKLAGHRRLVGRRRAAGIATGLAASVVAAQLFGISHIGRSVDTGAPGAPTHQAGRWTVFGVSLTLPSGWSVTEAHGPDGQRQACLATLGASDARCAVTLVVASDPAQAPTSGIDITQFLFIAPCAATRTTISPTVTLDHFTVQDRPASHYTARCTPTSVSTEGWILDNRTVAIIAMDPGQDATAAASFRSLTTPADWPPPEKNYASASPAP